MSDNLSKVIGNTPMVKLKNVNDIPVEIHGKLEMLNPTGSVKDRVAIGMIEAAERNEEINEDTILIEATSGNTGLGLAMIAAIRGYRLQLVFPDTVNQEIINHIKGFGAEEILSPDVKMLKGAMEKAEDLERQQKNSVYLRQFENNSNPQVHRETTAREILDDMDGEIDILVMGVGTGGTLTGVGEVIKEHNPEVKIVAVEPQNSQILARYLSLGKFDIERYYCKFCAWGPCMIKDDKSEGKCGRDLSPAGPHLIEGIGVGFVPEILNTSLIDDIIVVSDKRRKNVC